MPIMLLRRLYLFACIFCLCGIFVNNYTIICDSIVKSSFNGAKTNLREFVSRLCGALDSYYRKILQNKGKSVSYVRRALKKQIRFIDISRLCADDLIHRTVSYNSKELDIDIYLDVLSSILTIYLNDESYKDTITFIVFEEVFWLRNGVLTETQYNKIMSKIKKISKSYRNVFFVCNFLRECGTTKDPNDIKRFDRLIRSFRSEFRECCDYHNQLDEIKKCMLLEISNAINNIQINSTQQINVIQNITYIIHDGNEMISHAKSNYFNECNDLLKHRVGNLYYIYKHGNMYSELLAPGNPVAMFLLNNLRLEICFDVAMCTGVDTNFCANRLSRVSQYNEKYQPLLYIVQSNTISLDDNIDHIPLNIFIHQSDKYANFIQGKCSFWLESINNKFDLKHLIGDKQIKFYKIQGNRYCECRTLHSTWEITIDENGLQALRQRHERDIIGIVDSVIKV